MAGFDDLVAKGRKAYEDNKDRIDQARRSEKAEGISDKVLDGVADFAKKIAPDQHDARIDELRDKADRHIGNE